jgi:hypothetical protein
MYHIYKFFTTVRVNKLNHNFYYLVYFGIFIYQIAGEKKLFHQIWFCLSEIAFIKSGKKNGFPWIPKYRKYSLMLSDSSGKFH